MVFLHSLSFKLAADEQQEWAQLPESFSFGIQIIAGVLFVGGWFLVGAAYYRLGITGMILQCIDLYLFVH